MRVTVQVVDAPEFTVLGLQLREEIVVGATRLKVAVFEEPLAVAVMVALWFVVIVATVAVKFVEVLLAGTVTELGWDTAELLLDSATLVPPVGAASVRVTVQVVEDPELTLLGLQLREET